MQDFSTNIEIGLRVKEKRILCNYTREALAEILEISPQFLAQIETGKRGMSFTTLAKVSQVLGVSCDYLILGKTASPDQSRINELIGNMDESLIPIAEEMLGNILKISALSKN